MSEGPCRRWRAAPLQDEGRAREKVVAMLRERFPDTPRQVVRDSVDQAWQDLAEATTRDYVPVLAARAAGETLAEMVHAR